MPFLTPLQECTHHKLLAQEKKLNSASKVANWIISRYSEVSLAINLLLSLAKSSLFEIVIAKDPSYLSLQYFMSSVIVAYQ